VEEARLGVVVRNLAVAPLERNNVPVGVVEAVNKRNGAFSEADLQLLRLLAFDIASAVDNARTYEREMRERSENEILQRVSSRLTRSLELKDVLQDILDALAELVPYDAAALYTLTGDGAGTLHPVAMRGYDPHRESAVQIKAGTGVVGWVAQTGRAIIVPDVSREPRYVNARDTTRSEATAPLLVGTRILGAFNLESERPNAFDERHLRLLESFANHAAIALQRAQLYEELESKQRIERELAIARGIQHSFQPRSSPVLEGFELAGVNEASEEVSGDYYDFIGITEGHLGLALADVSGKGIPAALIMASFRASLIAEIRNNYSIRTVLAKVNRLLVESTQPGQFVTAFYGVLDVARRRLTYANAGHNPPVLLRATGKAEELRSTGLILGSFGDAQFKERTLELQTGDVLLLYTDGLTEAFSPENEEFGLGRVEGHLRSMRDRPATAICSGMLAAVREFGGNRRMRDDVTLIVLKAT
jgi:serine phosphatase RsbU (regulator of sigma subunit)